MKKVVIKGRWNDPIEHEWRGDLITTLREMNTLTIEKDNTGYFFEIEDAKSWYLKGMKLPIFMNMDEILVAPTDYTVVEEISSI